MHRSLGMFRSAFIRSAFSFQFFFSYNAQFYSCRVRFNTNRKKMLHILTTLRTFDILLEHLTQAERVAANFVAKVHQLEVVF